MPGGRRASPVTQSTGMGNEVLGRSGSKGGEVLCWFASVLCWWMKLCREKNLVMTGCTAWVGRGAAVHYVSELLLSC